MKSGEFKVVFHLRSPTQVLLSLASQESNTQELNSWKQTFEFLDYFFGKVSSKLHFNGLTEWQQARPGLSQQPLLHSIRTGSTAGSSKD